MISKREPKRGEVWYCTIPYATGHEVMKNRPAIVIGDPGNGLFVVVFCSASQTGELWTQVTVRSLMHSSKKGRLSVAMCDQIATVDRERLTSFMCKVTGSELMMVEACVGNVLGIGSTDLASLQAAIRAEMNDMTPAVDGDAPVGALADKAWIAQMKESLVALTAERDIYKGLYKDMLDAALGKKRRTTA